MTSPRSTIAFVLILTGAGMWMIADITYAQIPKPAPPAPARSQPLTLTQRLQYQVLYLQICGEAQIKPSVCSIDWSKGTVSDMTPAASGESK